MLRSNAIPSLREGERLDQKTFHERYCATAEDFHAELVNGLVVMPPRRVTVAEGQSRAALIACLGMYHAATPGTKGIGRITLILGENSEPEPHGCLYLDSAVGGRCQTIDDYLTGPPELVGEVHLSTDDCNLCERHRDYERSGVLEYVVILLREQCVRWFVRRSGHFEQLEPDSDGILKSQVFPGLWLNAAALLRNDSTALLATVQQGLQTAEHAQFVKKCNRADRGPAATYAAY